MQRYIIFRYITKISAKKCRPYHDFIYSSSLIKEQKQQHAPFFLQNNENKTNIIGKYQK